MDSFSIKDLAKIIERDSKDATYKFALLRGTIDIIQENDNYKEVVGQTVTFPMGLLILKWIEYYYPILSHDSFIPQKHGDSRKRTIAFRPEFEKVIELYPTTRFADQLFYDLKKGILDPFKIETVHSLVKKIKHTIINQPMHYIGSAIGQGGEIYTYNRDSSRNLRIGHLTLEWIINHSGTFSMPIGLYDVLQTVGRFVTGSHSIIFRWAEFTSRLSTETAISTSDMISLLKNDFNERDILRAKNYYADMLKSEQLECVWTGRTIKKDLHIDHMVPFVAYRNNDLWNLLPTLGSVNTKKSDKVPSGELLSAGAIRERIIGYWDILYREFTGQFKAEIQVSLLGRKPFSDRSWKNDSYENLTHLCNHLIEDRGFEPYKNI